MLNSASHAGRVSLDEYLHSINISDATRFMMKPASAAHFCQAQADLNLLSSEVVALLNGLAFCSRHAGLKMSYHFPGFFLPAQCTKTLKKSICLSLVMLLGRLVGTCR